MPGPVWHTQTIGWGKKQSLSDKPIPKVKLLTARHIRDKNLQGVFPFTFPYKRRKYITKNKINVKRKIIQNGSLVQSVYNVNECDVILIFAHSVNRRDRREQQNLGFIT